jgi:predicted DNA-binding protein
MAMKRFSKRAAFMLGSMHVDMLQQLADRDGVTTSDVVRRLIVEAHRATFGDQMLGAAVQEQVRRKKPTKAAKRK